MIANVTVFSCGNLGDKPEVFISTLVIFVVTIVFQCKEIQFPLIVNSNNFLVRRVLTLILTRSDCISFHRWLRRKRIEKLAEQQAVRERTRQLRLEAKHSKQLQSHLYMSEAKSFRFTDHYNWKYLLNTSVGSCYPQNFGYYFLWSVYFGHTLNYGNAIYLLVILTVNLSFFLTLNKINFFSLSVVLYAIS